MAVLMIIALVLPLCILPYINPTALVDKEEEGAESRAEYASTTLDTILLALSIARLRSSPERFKLVRVSFKKRPLISVMTKVWNYGSGKYKKKNRISPTVKTGAVEFQYLLTGDDFRILREAGGDKISALNFVSLHLWMYKIGFIRLSCL